MSNRSLIIGLSFSLLATSLSAVSLRDSVEKALNSNPTIVAERINQEAYKLYVDEREGKYLPTIDLETYLESAKEKRNYDVVPSGSTDNIWLKENGYNAAIIVRQYVYDGGLTPAQVDQTVHQELANKYRSFNAIENTVLEAIKSYTALVQSDEKLSLTESMIKIHEDNLATAKQNEEISGQVLETYQVTSKLGYMTDKLVEEQDLKVQNTATYERYLGEEPKGAVCRPEINKAFIPKTVEDAVKLAILRNNEILEEIENIKMQRSKIAQANANFLPNIYIELKASIDSDLELSNNGRTDNRYARLYFNWNLFNGNRDSIQTEQEKIFLNEHKKTLDDITSRIVSEVKSLYNKVKTDEKRVEALKQYVDANVNIVDVYKSEFEAGTRTFVDILDAESELYQSSISLINMEYNALSNYYDLMFNLSMLSDSVLTTSNQVCENVKPRVIDYTPKKQDKTTDEDLKGLISSKDSQMIMKELGLE